MSPDSLVIHLLFVLSVLAAVTLYIILTTWPIKQLRQETGIFAVIFSLLYGLGFIFFFSLSFNGYRITVYSTSIKLILQRTKILIKTGQDICSKMHLFVYM